MRRTTSITSEARASRAVSLRPGKRVFIWRPCVRAGTGNPLLRDGVFVFGAVFSRTDIQSEQNCRIESKNLQISLENPAEDDIIVRYWFWMERSIQGRMVPHAYEIHFCHGRRGLLPGQGNHSGLAGLPAQEPGTQGLHSEVRSVYQRRSGHDESLSARRGVRHRRRRGDRPRPGPL